jgi:hypothetical protein
MNIAIGNLKADVPLFKEAFDYFLDWIFDYAIDVVSNGVKSLISDIFTKNPAPGFGKCAALGEDISVASDGICIGFLDSLAGLWYSYLMLGIFLVFPFIGSVLVKKRIAWSQQSTKKVKPTAEKKKTTKTMAMADEEPFVGP